MKKRFFATLRITYKKESLNFLKLSFVKVTNLHPQDKYSHLEIATDYDFR